MKVLLRLRSLQCRVGLAKPHRRLLCLLLFMSGLLPLAHAQCPTENVTLTTQEAVNTFPPGCENLMVGLTIHGANINDLRPLSNLKTVESLEISDTPLTTLTGLNSLTSVQYRIELRSNKQLSNLEGLEKLASAGNLELDGNSELRNVSGLNSLTSLGGLSIRHCDRLESLAGLEKLSSLSGLVIDESDLNDLQGLSGLTTIWGSVNLARNSSLRSLEGLNKLTKVGEEFKLIGNETTSLSGLNSLTSIGGNLEIESIEDLESLAGLNKLATVGGNLLIEDNDDLTDISDLTSLTSIKGNLTIIDNRHLSKCNIEAVCSYLANPPGSIRISNNDDGCNSKEEVEDGCAPLTISPLLSGTTVCSGANVKLTVSTTGPARTYQWYKDGQSLTSQTRATLTLTSVQPSDAGSYSVVVSNSVSSLTSTAFTLTVNESATVSLSSSGTLTCANASVTLRAEPAAQGTYAFSGPGLSQSSTVNTATATRSGTYSVVLTVAGVCSASATVEVSQNVAPPTGVSLSSSGTLSANTPTVTLTASSNTTAGVGVSYAFSPPAQKISDNQTRATTSGTYSVTATRADNGCSATATTNVLGASSATACRGTSASINLTVAGSPVRYEWYVGVATGQPLRDGSVYQGTATASLRVVSVTQSQVYYARVFYADGSSVVYGPYRVTLNTNCGAREAAGVNSPTTEPGTELRITLLGNPLQGEVLRAQVSGAQGQRLYVQLLEVNGRLVRSQFFESAESSQLVEWDVSRSASGLYLLQASTSAQQQTLKVLKP